MLGASLYLSEGSEKNIQFVKKVSEEGIKKIFTSLHIPEDDTSKTLAVLKEITAVMNERGIELITDVSSGTLTQYNVEKESTTHFFKDLGVKSLRIDYGFSFEEMKNLSKAFNIVLNASIIDEDYCNKLDKVGLNPSDITVCHNFYPRENTGLERTFFLERNKYLKEKGFSVMAFISGNQEKRGPVYAGLPTLEEHRYMDPLEAYLDLTTNYLVDEVLIGDISVSENSLKRLMKWVKDEVLLLPVKVTSEENLTENFYSVHSNRKDVAADVVRASQSRIDLKGVTIQPTNCILRKTGSVTIDNSRYGRYSGEIQITKKDLPADNRVNVLAQVNEKNIGLIHYIGPGGKFQFYVD